MCYLFCIQPTYNTFILILTTMEPEMVINLPKTIICTLIIIIPVLANQAFPEKRILTNEELLGITGQMMIEEFKIDYIKNKRRRGITKRLYGNIFISMAGKENNYRNREWENNSVNSIQFLSGGRNRLINLK